MGTYSVHTTLWSATVTGQDRGGRHARRWRRAKEKKSEPFPRSFPSERGRQVFGVQYNQHTQAQESESESHLISSTYIVDLSSLFLFSFYFLSIGQCVSWPKYVLRT